MGHSRRHMEHHFRPHPHCSLTLNTPRINPNKGQRTKNMVLVLGVFSNSVEANSCFESSVLSGFRVGNSLDSSEFFFVKKLMWELKLYGRPFGFSA